MQYVPPVSFRINRQALKSFINVTECRMSLFLHCCYPLSFVEFRLISVLRGLSPEIYRTYCYYVNMESFVMAAKFDWNFVEIKLQHSDRENVIKFASKYGENILEVIDDITELGYKVSISYVDTQNSYVVSVSGTDRSGMNNKQTVTSWSNNLEECIAIAGYKILQLARDKDWKELETHASNWG